MTLRAVPYEVPYRRPIRTAHGTLLTRRGWWVVARDASGLPGLGEVAPLPEWGTESFAEAERALDSLTAPSSHPPLTDPAAWLATSGLSRDLTPATYAGVELALWDLASRTRRQSLASLLDDSPLDRVPVNALLTSVSTDELALEARRRVEEGYGTLKVKVGIGAIAEDARRIRAVREAVGPSIRLRADANGAWDHARAVEALKQLRPFDLDYLEQPVPEASGLSSLRDLGLVPIAADESAQDAQDVRRLIETQAVDWLILKPMALGGLHYTRRLAEAALQAGIGVTLTSVLDRGIGTAAALHLAAAMRLSTACGLSNTHMAPEHFLGPLPHDGYLEVHGAGHGIPLAALAPEQEAEHDRR